MLHLIPEVKHLQLTGGTLARKAVCCAQPPADGRLQAALAQLPTADDGVPLHLHITGAAGEGYVLAIEENAIIVTAQGPAGAFYAIQTLRQVFAHDTVPCLHIDDAPDFAYRGFYHDASRGRIPTVASVKHLVDQMAYYKLNSLQLYVEHSFAFREYAGLHGRTGCFSADELHEIDRYCSERFIEFIPSLSTFGHLYELLQQPQYQHLRVLADYAFDPNEWHARMAHHTIDPRQQESIALIRSLIDQYVPHFTSDTFNICCDETFDLKVFDGTEYDPSALYVGFVTKIAEHLQQKGKKVMMWADIALKYPDAFAGLPEDLTFLNWEYGPNPKEEQVRRVAELGRRQIVCPGTSTWNRFCENVTVEEQNITRMVEYGHRYGAEGVLNTNWGDWGNPCGLELAQYGLVLGAAKAWAAQMPVDDAFYAAVDHLLYGHAGAMALLKDLSALHDRISWTGIWRNFYHTPGDYAMLNGTLADLQQHYDALCDALAQGGPWADANVPAEMLLSAQAVCLLGELAAALAGRAVQRRTDTEAFLQAYRHSWLRRSKESELGRIEAHIRALAQRVGG